MGQARKSRRLNTRNIGERLLGYRRWLAHEWRQRRFAVQQHNKKKVFDAWLAELLRQPPEVLIGANFANFGGVRHHLQAIARYSSLDVALAPSDHVMRKVGAHAVANEFSAAFRAIPLTGIKAVHSHVYPWFIDWCEEKTALGVRWIHTYHLNYYAEHGTDGLEPWQEQINHKLLNVACRADVCLSVSRWQVEELRDKHGIKAHYLPNGIDVALCDTANADTFTRQTGLSRFVLFVGRNDPVKNPAEFVRLAAKLQKQPCVMIGGGLSEACIRQEWGLQVPDNLTVLGSLPRQQVLSALAACSVLVVTSKREGLPTLVMEAMALQKEVVVPDVAGCVEVVGHGEAGHVYRLGDIDHLSEITMKALRQPTMGGVARERVLKEYDWRVIAPQLDAVYRASGGV